MVMVPPSGMLASEMVTDANVDPSTVDIVPPSITVRPPATGAARAAITRIKSSAKEITFDFFIIHPGFLNSFLPHIVQARDLHE